MKTFLTTLARRISGDEDILPVAIYGWWIGQCYGWLSPWGKVAEEVERGWFFAHALDILAAVGIFMSVTALVCWYQRRWRILSFIDILSGVMAVHVAMGLYSLATDPPATSYIVWMGLSFVSSQRSARKETRRMHLRQLRDQHERPPQVSG